MAMPVGMPMGMVVKRATTFVAVIMIVCNVHDIFIACAGP